MAVEENRQKCMQLAFQYYATIHEEGYDTPSITDVINAAKKIEKYIFEWHQEALNKLGKES